MEGDSAYVMGLLDRRYLPNDMFFHNCLELIRDMLGASKHFSPSWISRTLNSECDALARQAVLTASPTVIIHSPLFIPLKEVWE